MSSEQKNVIRKATIEVPGHFSGVEMVTVTGRGPEVFALAYEGYRIASGNGAQPVLHFYVEDREVPWRGVVAEMDAALSLKDALSRLLSRSYYEDLPF